MAGEGHIKTVRMVGTVGSIHIKKHWKYELSITANNGKKQKKNWIDLHTLLQKVYTSVWCKTTLITGGVDCGHSY